ncbi:MAG TPA: DnaJ domain-containing protein, partial [Chthoniobacterales bacterium]|nr:DnaJ domain-containing protein [Chthoniobacterales bacterium]
MTDYFALLDQPRQPWLDPEQLKQAFHARTLQAHPDARPNESRNSFAEVNEAYQVLRDPKRRLQHLLALHGDAPSPQAARVPTELEELFPRVAGLLREAEIVQGRITTAATALTRFAAVAEATQLQAEVGELLAHVRGLEANALTCLRTTDSEDKERLRTLYLLFSYL